MELIPATNWFPFDWHAYGIEAGEADSDKLKQALEDITIKAVIFKNVSKMHEHAIFLGYAVEHCKATIAAKVHIKRLEDLGSEVSETELQSKVKGKVLLPYLNELDKDRAKSISVSLFISTVEVSLLCLTKMLIQDLDLTLYIVHYIVIYIFYIRYIHVMCVHCTLCLY